MLLEILLGTRSWKPCSTNVPEILACKTCFSEPCLGTCSWECLGTLLGNLFLETLPGNFSGNLTCEPVPCLRTSSWEPWARISLLRPAPRPFLWLKTLSLRCWGNMFLKSCLGNGFWKPCSKNIPEILACKTCSWEPCLGTCSWEPFPGNAWEPCLGTSWEPFPGTLPGNFFRNLTCEPLPWNLVWESLAKNLAWEPVPGNLAWGPVPGNLAWELLPGNLALEPCLGTCSWEPCLGTSSWEPCVGICSWEPCLGTLLGNLFHYFF